MILVLFTAVSTVSLVPLLWSLLIGTLLPGLTELVTNGNAPPRLKAFLTAVLAGVSGAATGYLTGPPSTKQQWEQIVASIAVTWVVAGVAYLTGWKPLGASGALSRATKRFGLGPRRRKPKTHIFRRGLKPFDPRKHARFTTARQYGFTFPAPTYPIDKRFGLGANGMGGNGPDPTLTGPFAQFAANGLGDCGPCYVPMHVDMLAACMLGASLASATMTSNQVATLYFIYQAQLLGITWNPATPPNPSWDQGVDLGDWLIWLATHDINGNKVTVGNGVIEAFVAIDLTDADAALAFFDFLCGGWILTDQTDQDFVDNTTADVGSGNAPDPNEGHCFGYQYASSASGPFAGPTWGGWLFFTLAYRKACLQQLFAIVTRAEAEAKGFVAQYEAIVAGIEALGGTVPPPLPPPPAPIPPAPPVTPSPDPNAITAFVHEVQTILSDAEARLEAAAKKIIGEVTGQDGQ